MKFEQRVVAFIDILGFSSLVKSANNDKTAFQDLSKLIELLESAVPIQNEKVNPSLSNHLIPKHLYISDCIILSAPLEDLEVKNYQ